eukprot:136492_1
MLKKLHNFITEQQFDTETVEYDMDIYGEYGNIEECIRNSECIKQIKQFINCTKISRSSFSIGLRFYYWDFYKSLKESPKDEQELVGGMKMNINDHSGFSICELFIIPKYDSFKQE